MTWLLDVVDDHRAAVKYDLLKHGRRLSDLGTPALSWSDALVLLTMQPPGTSAMWRELHPAEHDRTPEAARLEILAVQLSNLQTQIRYMHSDKAPPESEWTQRFEQLLATPEETATQLDEAQILAEMQAFNELIGRG